MNSSLRIGGMASGIDTDKVVSDLMKAERAKLDTLNQKKQVDEWRTDAYNEYNKALASFLIDIREEFGLDSYSNTGVLSKNSTKNLKWVKKASVSDEDYANVSATSSSINGTFDVHVTELAKNKSFTSSGTLDGDFSILKDQFGLADTDVIEFTIKSKNGLEKTFKYGGSDLDELTVKDIVDDINDFRGPSGKDLGVKAVYDANMNRFFLQTKNTGEDEGFTITKGASATVNFIAGTDNKLKLATDYDTEYKGTNGLVDFAGATGIVIKHNNVNFYGIEMELKQKDVDFTVKVDTDVDSVYKKIEGFVEKYNELLDKFSAKLGEKKYSDYKPLSSEQKKSMADDEIKMWTSRAKSGVLRDDELFTSAFDDVRGGFYEKVTKTKEGFSFLFELGITTEKYDSSKAAGRLKIDEQRLKKAIDGNVEGVLEMLFKEPDPTVDDPKIANAQSGIFTRMQDKLTKGIQNVIHRAGTDGQEDLYRKVKINILVDFVTKKSSISDMEQDMYKLDDEIDDMKDYLKDKENSYWQKFTAMEKAVQKMQSQSQWMMQQMG